MKTEFFSKLSDLFFPPKCVHCGEIIGKGMSRALCDNCFVSFVKERETNCSVCGKPYYECFCRPDLLKNVPLIYGLPYDKMLPVSSSLILSVKNKYRKDSTEMLCGAIERKAEIISAIPSDAIVTFLPRSPEKIAKYGVDQAEKIAERIARVYHLKFKQFFYHKLFGEEQKNLNYKGRIQNAQCNYGLKKSVNRIPKNKPIILVDDIVTTGSTMSACISLLNNSGFCNIICVAAAKRDKHGEPQI